MFNKYRKSQHEIYLKARQYFVENHRQLIELEKYFSDTFYSVIGENIQAIAEDYNETSYLFPFWQNYPPDARGRQPIGDQYPWIEVGEHVFSSKLTRLLEPIFRIRDVGLPTGADLRLVVSNEAVGTITKGFTSYCWLFVDVKSVGPRDDQDHTVMSHNQISGNGKWETFADGIENTIMKASGQRISHDFHSSAPPLFVLSNGSILPAICIVIKPVYRMLTLDNANSDGGQPLGRIELVTIPNGLLLEEKPNYLAKYPSLFFPGKDDKSKNPVKVRCRVSFSILRLIAEWRVRTINVPS